MKRTDCEYFIRNSVNNTVIYTNFPFPLIYANKTYIHLYYAGGAFCPKQSLCVWKTISCTRHRNNCENTFETKLNVLMVKKKVDKHYLHVSVIPCGNSSQGTL